ncbi:MAG: tRNA uridine-5-carboxymethylaminomethyl(34) synthesis enzyme MnmG [Gemmatimonadales bacterium]|nr:MAG: tRNA uridine-5-carboxymethylaminomethyl(34) synthesis enzyme MnmG [Gemmatimonadales bacterium]
MLGSYDVVVIGGGHAGVEAASASARMGCRTLLVTPDLARIGQMSCNPAIGGVAKGVVAREIDAMGGIMGAATDASTIHFRMLNRSKGPAVWGPRAQCDRGLYPRAVRTLLDETPGLDLFQGTVDSLVASEGAGVEGIVLRGGMQVPARAVVVTAGTFLRGRMHTGPSGEGEEGGRAGEPAVRELAESLERAGLEMARFKTGTPPRVDGRTVDVTRMERQDGETEDFRFSFWAGASPAGALPCWLTWTGAGLRDIVQRHIGESALYGGAISGQGPRYCPSIEDKIVRFPDAPRHKVFLEPEGLETTEMYVNGLSTSLPPEVQLAFLRSIPGLEEVRITKMGYAIEYDYLPPQQLRRSLEVRGIPGLFLAGQVNGTTGYEEAAGQGLVAGVNAALGVQKRQAWVPGRQDAYLGVLVDDLVTRGVDEPYRLFTSRAEFRLLLRQDNAPERLAAHAVELGMLPGPASEAWEERTRRRAFWRGWLDRTKVMPREANSRLEDVGSAPLREPASAGELAKRPELEAADLVVMTGGAPPRSADLEILQGLVVGERYAGYVRRDEVRAARLRKLGGRPIPDAFSFRSCRTLSMEAREQLERARPETLAQAAGLRGVSPADLQALSVELSRRGSG